MKKTNATGNSYLHENSFQGRHYRLEQPHSIWHLFK